MLPTIRPVKSRKNELDSTTLREFDGGWNVLDNDLSLSTKYSKILENLVRESDGGLQVRWGTRLYADLSSVSTATLINITYFQDTVIAVMSDGEIYYLDSSGNPTELWSAAKADWQGVAAWGNVDFISFISFGGELVINNGTDKPLVVDLTQEEVIHRCQYLQDLGTGTNANVPIARYVTVVGDYVLMAGDPVNPGRLHISHPGTSGTWYGDPDPNDATFVDIDKKVHTNTGIINGITFYKGKVIIIFDELIVVGTLGIYNDTGEHVPTFNEVFYAHGGISHRSLAHIGDDLLMCDNNGTPSFKQSAFLDTLTPFRPSKLIDPAIQKNLAELSTGALTKDVWAIYNQLDQQYMLFMPNHDNNVTQLDNDPFVIGDMDNNVIVVTSIDHQLSAKDSVTFTGAQGFNAITASDLNTTHTVVNIINEDLYTIILSSVTLDPTLNVFGGGTVVTATYPRTQSSGYVMNKVKERTTNGDWTFFSGWDFSCGCKSLLGRLFFGEHSGNKIFVYGTKQDRITADFVDDNPTDISWVWELPWTSLQRRMHSKKFRYIGFDTRGTARFTAKMFVDDIYIDELGNLNPQLEMDFFGGDIGGYGQGSQAYGGGRRTDSERLYNWTTKGKIVKLRLEGATQEPLRIIAVMFAFLFGSIRR